VLAAGFASGDLAIFTIAVRTLRAFAMCRKNRHVMHPTLGALGPRAVFSLAVRTDYARAILIMLMALVALRNRAISLPAGRIRAPGAGAIGNVSLTDRALGDSAALLLTASICAFYAYAVPGEESVVPFANAAFVGRAVSFPAGWVRAPRAFAVRLMHLARGAFAGAATGPLAVNTRCGGEAVSISLSGWSRWKGIV
jgi:hypothetical protein